MMNKIKTEKSFTKKEQKCVPDIYDDVNQIYDVLRKLNFKNSNVIMAIDISNESIQYKKEYVHVLTIIANTLKEFDDDGLIPTLMFNDDTILNMKQFITKDENSKNCHGLDDVMRTFNKLTNVTDDDKTIIDEIDKLYKCEYGINKMFGKVKEILNESVKGEYYILITLTSGHNIKMIRNKIDEYKLFDKLTKEQKETLKHLKRRKHVMKQHDKKMESNIKSMCKYPMSMINIGINDNADCFDAFETVDDLVKGRKFDNYQFVNYKSIFNVLNEEPKNKQNAQSDVLSTKQIQDKFVLEILREIPIQYSFMLENNMLKNIK